MSRAMKIMIAALTLSLAVNFFAVGYIAGRGFESARWGHHGPRGGEMMTLRGFAGALPEDARQQLRREIRADRRQFRADRRALRALRRDVGEALRAEQIDRAAIADAFAEIDAVDNRRRARIRGALIDVAAALSPEERRAVLDRLEAHLSQRHRR